MKVLSIIIVALLFSCTPEKKCELAQSAIDKMVPAIASGFECKNDKAIKSDLFTLATKAGLCKSEFKSKIPPIICELLAAEIVKYVAKQIPESWECTADNAQDKLDDILVRACESI